MLRPGKGATVDGSWAPATYDVAQKVEMDKGYLRTPVHQHPPWPSWRWKYLIFAMVSICRVAPIAAYCILELTSWVDGQNSDSIQ